MSPLVWVCLGLAAAGFTSLLITGLCRAAARGDQLTSDALHRDDKDGAL
jgi:hypothetical protein